MPLFHRGMVNYTKQIWKCCNWSTAQNKYGSAVIYAVYFTVAWSTMQNKYGSAGEFLVFSVIVCAWSTTRRCVGDSLVWGSLRLAPITLASMIFCKINYHIISIINQYLQVIIYQLSIIHCCSTYINYHHEDFAV